MKYFVRVDYAITAENIATSAGGNTEGMSVASRASIQKTLEICLLFVLQECQKYFYMLTCQELFLLLT